MAIYSTPGIRITEKDNSIKSNSNSIIGVGAIVMKSNRGPVNQRVLSDSYTSFTNVYGEPEVNTDYGHFAAENYLSVSNQLLSVRATMGDERYSQIQYPYTDASKSNVNRSETTFKFEYVNPENENYLDLIENITTSELGEVSAFTVNHEWEDPNASKPTASGFYLNSKAKYAEVADIISDVDPSIIVFKDSDKVFTKEGKYIKFASNITEDGKPTNFYDDLIFSNEGYTSKVNSAEFIIYETGENVLEYNGVSGYKTIIPIPESATLDNVYRGVTAYLTSAAIDNIKNNSNYTYEDLFTADNFYNPQHSMVVCEDPIDAVKFEVTDWDDCTSKIFYTEKDRIITTSGDAIGIGYREFGLADKFYSIADPNDSGKVLMKMSEYFANEPEKAKKLAEEAYGQEVDVVNNSKYSYLAFHDINMQKNEDGEFVEDSLIEKIVYTDSVVETDKLFWLFAKKDASELTKVSVYYAKEPEDIVIPWQPGIDVNVDPIIAIPTTEVLNGTNERYKNGYTTTIESDDEPGIGDIELFSSNKENQLVIAAIGPGEYGNDIGISIITPEAEKIQSLNHQNAFNWKYRYDDEDLVNENDEDTDFTWKKVYRINIYTKNKSQTSEKAWGSGLDALVKEPDEFWYVSNDPTAKDAEGNSLYAPTVINGHSNYIYVSRSSINTAIMANGEYAMPMQTFSIYQLTGGKNSKKDEIVQKTAALKLFEDKQKANFDILFNVDAVETFNGRQRYSAMQKKIAEIAAARGQDIGVVQVTSKEAKSIKRQLAEGKMFSFNNGSYVAPYAGYDKYYNKTLSEWIYLPKSIGGACAMAFCDMYAYPWMAPAGTARGTITYSTKQLAELTDNEIGQLYDNYINTSRKCSGYGEVLWGQKTALKKDSALNRINVRRCLNFIEKNLEIMMQPYLFQQNTASTRSSARNAIDSFLARIKASEGVISYALAVTQNTEDPHVMDVNITVIPAETLEFINITITVDRNSGITAAEG